MSLTAPALLQRPGSGRAPAPAPLPPVPHAALGRAARTAPRSPRPPGWRAALDRPPPTCRAGSPASCWTPPTGTALWGRTRRAGARPGLHRQAAHRRGGAADPQPDRTGSSPASWPARIRARSCWSAAATRRSPRCRRRREQRLPGRAAARPSWPTQVRKAAPGPIRRVLVDTSRYTGPTLAAGWFAADIARRVRRPDRAADARRRPDRPHVAGRPARRGPGADRRPSARRRCSASTRLVARARAAPGATAARRGVVGAGDRAGRARRCAARTTCWPRCSPARSRSPAAAEPSFAGAAEPGARRAPAGRVRPERRRARRRQRAVHARTRCRPGCSARCSPPRPRPRRAVRHAVPAPDPQRPAGGRRRRHARRPVRRRTRRAAAGRGVVRAKTGTLTGVSSLAGVVTDADGRLLVFALMSNGAGPGTVRPLLDAIAAELSRCGCR